MSESHPKNPYLQGNFAPVQEEKTAEGLAVIGEIPKDLEGSFVRNGPNPQFTPKGRYHWFDGDGMLHGVHLSQGKATYRNRYVRTKGFEIERAEGKAVWSGLTELPDFENPNGPFKNAANTALIWHNQKLLALWEGGNPHEVKLPSLETVGEHDFHGALTCPFTAHPKVDPETGEMMFFGYSPLTEPYLQYGVVSASGEITKIIPIDLPIGVMMHDFAVSKNYSIFLDLPLTFRLERAMQGEFPFAFEEDLPSRFGVLPRHGDPSEIKWFEGPACFMWHTLNAYEEGDEVVLLGCRVSRTNILVAATDTAQPKEEDYGRLHEWRFHLKTGTMKERALDDAGSEFPRLNESLAGRKARFGYAAKLPPFMQGDAPFLEGVIKYDLVKGSSQTHTLGKGQTCGEWVFAPKANATAEDDGYLLSYSYDQATNGSALVILDASDITQAPLAKVVLPQRVPYGFHGAWIPSK